MIYIESKSRDPYYNLALEEYVFEHMDKKEEYFLLWQNKNTIVIGRYQNTAEEINHEFVKAQDIKVARRLSGGGAVYHDDGNLNFTFIVNKDTIDDFNFKVFVQPVVAALAKLGVTAEFNGRNDITIDGKKFSGNSQYMRKKRIMHHGCIMLDSNINIVSEALKTKAAKFESKSVKSVKSRVTTINANAPERISMQCFQQTLKDCVAENTQMQEYHLTAADEAAIEKLKKEKYETWEWNYGFFPAYEMRYEKKFPAGLVSIDLQADHNRIKNIRIAGDFFGNEDITYLEQGLIGTPLDEGLVEKLKELHLEHYMNGIAAEDLANMIR